jgi:Bacteriophage Mu, GemA protein
MAGDLRTRELALIHLGRKELGLDDGAYRGLIGRISRGRTDSSAQLTEAERRDVIEHMRDSGFKPKPKEPAAKPARGDDPRLQAAKLRALWRSLHDLGVARVAGDDALAAFVSRHTNRQALRWNSADDLGIAIDCLKGWCRRIGYAPLPSQMEGPCFSRFEPSLIRAQWARLIELGAFRHGNLARLDTWLAHQGYPAADPGFLTVADAQAAIRKLGDWLRRLAAERPDPGDGGDA